MNLNLLTIKLFKSISGYWNRNSCIFIIILRNTTNCCRREEIIEFSNCTLARSAVYFQQYHVVPPSSCLQYLGLLWSSHQDYQFNKNLIAYCVFQAWSTKGMQQHHLRQNRSTTCLFYSAVVQKFLVSYLPFWKQVWRCSFICSLKVKKRRIRTIVQKRILAPKCYRWLKNGDYLHLSCVISNVSPLPWSQKWWDQKYKSVPIYVSFHR